MNTDNFILCSLLFLIIILSVLLSIFNISLQEMPFSYGFEFESKYQPTNIFGLIFLNFIFIVFVLGIIALVVVCLLGLFIFFSDYITTAKNLFCSQKDSKKQNKRRGD